MGRRANRHPFQRVITLWPGHAPWNTGGAPLF